MAIITNFGTMNYNSGGTQATLNSNIVTTTLNVDYSSEMLKSAFPTEFSISDRIKYQVFFKNTSTGTFINPVVTDNLGTTSTVPAITPQSYEAGSVSAFLYNENGTAVTPLAVTENIGTDSVSFNITGNIPAGYTMILNYETLINGNLGADVTSITNTATLTAETNTQATAAVYTDSASATITRRTISIVKSASAGTVNPGDPLTYTFTLSNIGTDEVTINNITDQLPENFRTGNTITAVIGTTPVTYTNGTDYTVSESNLLVIQPAATSTPLTIPAASGNVPGVTTITISGTIDA